MPDDAPNPRAVIGANNPPDSFEAIRIHCEGLYMEAKHWLDGAAISNDAEAEAVTKLLEDARKAFDAADAQRVVENEPFDKGKAAVQEKYAPLIGKTKAITGTMVRMQEACKAALAPWRQKKADEAAAAAAAARKEAEAKAAAAAEAARASQGNLEQQEAAEELIRAADQAQRDASRATKAATTGTGLSTYYEAVLTNQREAMLHYMKDRPGEFIGLCQRLAEIDVRAGKRTIPGFAVEERKRVR
jgi:hypothetical protein